MSEPTPETLAYAKRRTLEALDSKSPGRLQRYYDVRGDYVGASFVNVGDNDPYAITPDDLLATHLLSIRFTAGAVRRLIEDDVVRRAVSAALRDLPAKPLADADDACLEKMAVLYDIVKSALAAPDAKSSNAWVTASKICARKRPGLFPVRDNIVCEYLGLRRLSSAPLDWRVFGTLVQDPDVLGKLEGLRSVLDAERAAGATLRVDDEDLRVLDAALWTKANHGRTDTEA